MHARISSHKLNGRLTRARLEEENPRRIFHNFEITQNENTMSGAFEERAQNWTCGSAASAYSAVRFMSVHVRVQWRCKGRLGN